MYIIKLNIDTLYIKAVLSAESPLRHHLIQEQAKATGDMSCKDKRLELFYCNSEYLSSVMTAGSYQQLAGSTAGCCFHGNQRKANHEQQHE